MRKMVLAAMAAFSALACAEAASGFERVATRAWVLRQLQGLGDGGRKLDVAVETNANATVSYSSPWTSEDVTNAVAIRLTFAAPRIVARPVRATADGRRRITLLDLLFPSALAQGLETGADNALRIVLRTGEWIDGVGNAHRFNLGADGLELTLDDEMPEIPDPSHECDFPPADCTCNGSKYTEADLEKMCPEDYRDWTVAEYSRTVDDVTNWIDEDGWSDKTTGRNGGTTYWIVDVDGVRVSLNSIAEKSDAWTAALAEGLVALNGRMRACREAYKRSLRCDKENPQHIASTSKCGTRCGRCTRWLSGPDHKGWKPVGDSRHSCDCGEIGGEHGGSWTMESALNRYQSAYVKRCAVCGYRKEHLHEHAWERCQPCAGDGTIGSCGVVCAGCGGQHAFTAPDSCQCQCEDGNCDEVPQGIEGHTGWQPCSDDVEADNDDGTASGAHCQCACLKFGHNANTSHRYAGGSASRPLTDAESARFPKDERHMTVFGDCSRCGQHTSKARPHSFPSEPERENVSATVCRRKWECAECRHVKKDDTEGHSRDADNGCVCANGCGFQFEHEWTLDECGNTRCGECGTLKPGVAQRHGGFDAGPVVGTGCHVCGCRDIVEAHVWGTAVEFERDGETWNKAQCVGDGWGGAGCGTWIEWKSDHQHTWTDCEPCTCGMACKTCGGKHRFVERTCHACTCDGCTQTPDDISLHTGWQPCSDDVEADNDDGSASGAHCQCACLKFGHNAGTGHAYGDFEYCQQFDDEWHWKRKPACSRCHKPHGVKERHDTDGATPEYSYGSEEVCRKRTRCRDCDYLKTEEVEHVPTSAPTAYEFVSESTCRWWYDCRNCGRQKATHEDHAHGNKSAGTCECLCGHAVNHVGRSLAMPCYCQCGKVHLRISPNACGFCTYCKTTADGVDISVESRHSATNGATTCGCRCGHFGEGGSVAKSEALHAFVGEESNGVSPCTCQCSNKHVFRDFSARFKNENGGAPFCAVCAYCGIKRLDGTAATEDDHVEADNRCGCKCGALNHKAEADRFHPRRPGTCRCYGEDGKGGAHHFVQPRADCPGICRYSTGSDYHRVATHDHERVVVAAVPEDHRGKGYGSCGCRCGKYTESNRSEWESAGSLHAQDTTKCGCHCGHTHVEHRSHDQSKCKCDCGETVVEHRKVSGKCRCECGETVVTHEPVAGKCRCECGATVVQHVEGSANSCVCECGETRAHKFPAGAGCRACFCGDETRHVRGAGCYCECGKRVVEHIAVAGQCYCVCGGRLFGHVQGMTSCTCQCGSVTSHRFASSGTSGCNTCYCGAHTVHNQDPSKCGCYCGNSDKAGHHRQGDGCRCKCGETLMTHHWTGSSCWCDSSERHRPQTGACRNVCTLCGCLRDDSHAAAQKGDHSPKSGGCGCACGAYGGQSYPAASHARFHNGTGSVPCLCECGASHRNFSASECPNVCARCGMDEAMRNSGSGIHTFTASSCDCKCRAYTRHSIADDACACHCGVVTRAHDYKETRAKTGEADCPTCYCHVEKWRSTFVCTRCGDRHSYDWEAGHSPECGSESASSGEPTPCSGCGCTGCSCSACASGSGRCSTCGGRCGGDGQGDGGNSGGASSDGQSGSPDDIL